MQGVFSFTGNDCPSIVFDCGAHHVRAGYGGNFGPSLDIPAMVGYPRHRGVAMAAGMSELEVGESALAKRGMLSVSQPIENGIITNWEAVEGLWSDVLYSQLRATPESHAFLATQSVNAPTRQKEKMLELLMETFNVRSLYLGTSQVLSLYAYGLTTGVVVDSGRDRTLAVPVFEGYALGRHVTESPVAGALLTQYLGTLLREEGYSLSTAVERTLLNQAKEDLCYVRSQRLTYLPPRISPESSSDIISPKFSENNVLLSVEDVGSMGFNATIPGDMKEMQAEEVDVMAFELPDGQTIPLREHRYLTAEVLFNFSMLDRCPTTLEFLRRDMSFISNCSKGKNISGAASHPSYEPPYKVRTDLGKWFIPSFPKGIAWLPFAAIHNCDETLRSQLYANIVLAGNTLNLPGARSRLECEIVELYREKHSSEAVLPIQVKDMACRGYSAWLGASILSQMCMFPHMAITKQEYEENGLCVVHYKC